MGERSAAEVGHGVEHVHRRPRHTPPKSERSTKSESGGSVRPLKDVKAALKDEERRAGVDRQLVETWISY